MAADGGYVSGVTDIVGAAQTVLYCSSQIKMLDELRILYTVWPDRRGLWISIYLSSVAQNRCKADSSAASQHIPRVVRNPKGR